MMPRDLAAWLDLAGDEQVVWWDRPPAAAIAARARRRRRQARILTLAVSATIAAVVVIGAVLGQGDLVENIGVGLLVQGSLTLFLALAIRAISASGSLPVHRRPADSVCAVTDRRCVRYDFDRRRHHDWDFCGDDGVSVDVRRRYGERGDVQVRTGMGEDSVVVMMLYDVAAPDAAVREINRRTR